ncbi:hypothetical protein K431DRAFT_286159 [Polychaeton citri CBS 116435]|uniref:Uncharacterized protein n=1 Tax=Polychaeton citri CBS 116435 TaxID=1314669 RepID=A0A9P4Q5P4_9PEZI|nr:hypothetical protein K431DRAFT_286159 [Polychaeton citri CBS 116435]
MADTETFTQLPLSIDPSSKALSSTDKSIEAEIADINAYHKLLLGLDTPNQVPPPPAQLKPQRTVQINKMRESGNASYKKGAYAEAVRFYDMALRMAADRPPWEASGQVREELSQLYNNRAQALMAQQLWPAASVDAELSVELKKVGNVKGWWRRGQSLREMGRLQEASEWVKSGLDLEMLGPDKANLGELEALYKDLTRLL